MNAHQRKKNAKAFIAELKAHCDDEKVSSLLEAADDLRKLDKENEQLRQRVAELEEMYELSADVASTTLARNAELTAERDALKQRVAELESQMAEVRRAERERCAKRAEVYAYMSQNFIALAEEIRAME